ncbi:uncharacterized protein LOC126890102 [Diabrotica virgifera virgifera]|uniref:Peptidase aspartic putative domain-containing protein n=1 Tax=Diabrotica virgifera virgifera TaxID=50390 RepID=A0ABM5KXK7_DIAVI|nr:uncharacterized protein LOC126890102 [Diabrotica virgifera virgifera]
MADKLKKYTFQRRMAMNDLETLLRLSNSSLTEVHKQSLFRVRYSELDDVLESFNKNHQNIVTNLLNSEPTGAQLDSEDIIRSQFLNDYYQIKANFADLFENDDNSQKNEQNIAASNAVQPPSNVRLPQLELVKFSGEFTSAITFFDLFDALVHRRPNVDDTEKLTYLIQSLEGPPLRLAKSLPLARENYVRIYDKLKNRYLNKRLRAMAHWCKIEEAPATMFKNSDSYSNLIDTFSENLSALENLGYKISDFVLAYKILTKLDEETHQRFELLHGSSEMPTFIQLSDFLESQCISFDSSLLSPCSPKDSNRKNKSPSKHNANKNGSKVNNRYSFFSKPNATTCLLCSADHHLKDCSLFLNKSPYERYNACKRMRLCFKCLEKHDSRSCSVTSRCCHCNSSHHSLLHFKSSESATQGATSVAAVPTTASSDAQVNTGTLSSHAASLGSVTSKNSSVLLATAVVEIMDGCGLYQPVRALIDGGSMTSFVSQSCIRQLGIRHSSATLSVQGIGAIKSTVVGRVDLQIKPVDRVDPIFNCEAFVLPKICEDLPVVSLDVGHWSYIANLKLADPRFHLSGKVDLLLGADIFSQLLLEGKVQTPRGMPDALNTVFGYVLMGPCSSVPMTSATSLFCHVDQMVSLEESVKQFWSLETVPEVECSAPEDILCEKNFVENVCRDGSGRYTVALPFRELSPVFPGMFELAVNRFLSLEKRLLKNPSVYQEYCTFMKDYLDLHHMELVSSPDEELQEFRLLTYGVSSAPFLALRTLLQLSEDEGREFPLAAEVLRTSTYVDDIVCGGDTLEIALDLRNELISLLSRGQFELRKWSSNDMRLLEGLPESYIGKKPISFDDNSCSSPLKILGLVWNAQLDCFSFEVTALDKSCTKRSMLSELARVFDPVGFLAPMTLFTKHLIQRLWLSGIDWDDSPPDSICKVWNQYKEQLLSLAQLEIPRCMFVSRYICCEERLSPNSWFYVPSAQNPADLASRGVLPALMLEQSHWFAGPEFLYNTDPIPDASCCFSECAEMFDEERTNSKYITDRPEHDFEAIKSTSFLPENLIKVVDPVIERNAFFPPRTFATEDDS